MTTCCDSCICHAQRPCTSHHCVDNHHRICKRFRSTKGASKARRDQINTEIRNMRSLLPIGLEDQERLSYLHSMAAICTYFRKLVFLQGITAGQGSECFLSYDAFLQALHGFVLVTTTQGKLVYVSENVSEYLGHSMVDMLQADSLYDIVECSDIDTVKSNLEINNSSSTERSFVCSMQTSKAYRIQNGSCCSILVKGSFLPLSRSSGSSSAATDQGLFVALCTPTVNRLDTTDPARLSLSFSSLHRPDMTFTQLSDSVFYFLGYTVEEICGQSWYSLLHPEDLLLSADAHKSLMLAHEDVQVEMVLRLQCKNLSWTWVYVQATKDTEFQEINCTNYIISETEARFLSQKINSDAVPPSASSCALALLTQTEGCGLTKPSKRQRTPSSLDEEPSAKSRRGCELDVCHVECSSTSGGLSPVTAGNSLGFFTPPYSPASTTSPCQTEALCPDFLVDVPGYASQLLPSPEHSPSYYPGPEGGSPQASTGPSFTGEDFILSSRSPHSSLSPPYDFLACAVDARMVPDHSCVSDVCEPLTDCVLHPDNVSLLEPPLEGSAYPGHHVPQDHLSLLTPNASPTSQQSFHFSEREQVEISILAQQISSLASSFDGYHTLGHIPPRPAQETLGSAFAWPGPAPLHTPSLKPEMLLDESVLDCILKELVPGKGSVSYFPSGSIGIHQPGQQGSGAPTDSLPIEEFTPAGIAVDPFALSLGNHEQNTGLHQLDHYIFSSRQQDGLVEENLY